MMVLLLGTGLLLTVRAGFPQLTLLGRAWKLLSSPKEAEKAVTPRQALCTALAATVGTGNIIGVAGAICLGGPGAVFWMWVSGFLGMATKFAEVTLAGQYQLTRGNERLGGPMYTISRGMPPRWRFLAELYSFFGLAAAFGVGNATQINAVVSGVRQILGHGSLGVGCFAFGGRGSTANLEVSVSKRAIIERVEQRQTAQKRGLACARGADKGHDLAGVDVEVDVMQDLAPVERFAYVLSVNGRFSHGSKPASSRRGSGWQ